MAVGDKLISTDGLKAACDILNTDITDLKSAIDDITSAEYDALTGTITTGKTIPNTAKVDGAAAAYYVAAYEVQPGDRLRISGCASNYGYVYIFTDENDETVGTSAQNGSGMKNYADLIAVAPAQSKYLIVASHTSATYTQAKAELGRYTVTGLSELSERIDTFEEVLDDPQLMPVSRSAITKKDSYYIASNGSETSNSLWEIMSMSVVAGEKYQVTARYYSNVKGVFFYDDEDAFVPPYFGESDTNEFHTIDVTVPSGAVTMRINNYKTSGGSFGIKKYVTAINNNNIIINGKTIDQIVNSLGASGNVLYGKTLVTVGDSITYGADIGSEGVDPVTGALMTYGWQIANRNGMTFYNKGVSGSTVAAGTERNGFAEANGRYTQLPDSIDYLTIWFGWNDYACLLDETETLGDIDSVDTNSYYGAYNTVLPYLINKYPNARIGLIVPFGANAGIRQAVRDLAQKWGICYFDNYKGNTPLYYGKEDESVLASGLVAQCHAKWQGLGAHPNYAGHQQLATQIEAWLRTL